MNLLIDGLPTAIEIDGLVYEINSDYQTGIKIITAFEDKEITSLEKQSVLINLLYKNCPQNIEIALEKGVKFLNCGDLNASESEDNGQRVYSFSHDEKYIFSAVDRVLNGRLSRKEYVHWWEFVMAFMDLPEDCMMSKIIYYRTRCETGKLTKEEKKAYFDNRKVFELPLELTAEEQAKADDFMRLLEK